MAGLQSSLMFVGKARSLPQRRILERWSACTPALYTNITLGWKGLPGKNTPAYSEVLKVCYILGPRRILYKPF
jgi:hypothetical protein